MINEEFELLGEIASEIFFEGVFDDKNTWDEWEAKFAEKERKAREREEAKHLLRSKDNKYGDLLKRFNNGKEWKSVTLDQLKKWMKLNPGFYITVVDINDIRSGTRVPPIQITEPVTNSYIPRQIGTFNRGERALGSGRKGASMNIPFNKIRSAEAFKKDPSIITFTFDELSPQGSNRHTYKVLVTPEMPSEALLVAFNPTGEDQIKKEGE